MKRYKVRKVGTDEYIEDLLISSNNRCTVWWCKDIRYAKDLTKEEVNAFQKANIDTQVLVYKVKTAE